MRLAAEKRSSHDAKLTGWTRTYSSERLRLQVGVILSRLIQGLLGELHKRNADERHGC